MKDGKINIAYISHFPHYKMGGQRSMLALIENLDREKFHPFAILPAEGELSQKLKELNCTTKIIPLTSLKPKNARTIISNIIEIRKFIKKENIDILHPDFERDAFVAGIAKINTPAKMIWHVRLTRPENLDKINAFLSDGIIGVSSATKKRFLKVKNLDRKFITIFNGVDHNTFVPTEDKNLLRQTLGLPLNIPIIIFVGQIKDSKGVEDIINATEILLKKNIQKTPLLLLIGEYESIEYENKILKLIAEKHLSDIVLRKPQQNNIHQWMAAADILLLPSYEGSEGMGRVLFEAMACGTVPVGTNISGINEAISRDTGILIHEHSPSELASTIEKLITNVPLYNNLKNNTIERAKTVFDIKIHAANVQNFYYSILNTQ